MTKHIGEGDDCFKLTPAEMCDGCLEILGHASKLPGPDFHTCKNCGGMVPLDTKECRVCGRIL